MQETNEIRLKRLKWRSQHRGCKETDIILGEFGEKHLANMTPAQLDAFEALLDEDDAHIWDWLTGKAAPPDARYLPLVEQLKCFRAE